ncbi:nucleotidyltransferase domain-containing protein [Massilia sp. R2A-15]|uniref:nucleotidyltransferase family protein n=1 Tax=Massilia sp. R2A-15 TaxID=3064278 RepID=UPI0027338AE4|nr:nucleotidyltransferase domain-containing protein [Massilia sp. R2A-15]WLI89794.1 nucleotidyltransferase domain-containing protein [Massilia sp. R2A-15]
MDFGLPDAAIEKIRLALARHPEVEQAKLYGSRARGTFKNSSDIDLTLQGEQLTHRTLLRLMDELDDLLLPWMIDLSIFSALDHPALRHQIERDGVIFYERVQPRGQVRRT